MTTPLPRPTVVPPEKPAKSTRGRKPGTQAKVRQELPKDQFIIADVPEDERGNVKRARVERTAQQRAIDAKVLEVWRNWRDAGRPTIWNEMPVKEWPLDTRYEDDALFYLHKAATLHHKKLVVGDIKRRDGKSRIPFCVVDRKQKSDSRVPDNSATETPATAGNDTTDN